MTRPIFEPTTQRAIRSQGFGGDQLFRRPAPRSAGSTSSSWFADFTWNGAGNSIPDDTWTAVVTGVGGGSDRWFNEINTDPADTAWGHSFTVGWIKHSGVAYNFTAWGFASFDVADGTPIGAQIDWFGEEVMSNTGVAANGVPRIEVTAERTPIPTGGVRLNCWQNSGGAADLLEARLHVRRFELYQDVYVQEFAT